MQLKLHTLIIVIGPNSCGKTHLIDNYIKPQLRAKLALHGIPSVLPYIDTKQEYLLHCTNPNKEIRRAMQEMSIVNKLSQYMDFPFSESFIILEYSINKEEFISKCKETAFKFKYNIEYIFFSYKVHKDFFKFSTNKKTTQKRTEEYKKNILHALNIAILEDIIVSKTPIREIVQDFKLEFNETNFKYFESLILEKSHKYFIVGDVHSCIDELKKLLRDNKFLIDQDDIITCTRYDLIFVGDLIDKGNKNIEMINFIHKNISNPRIKFVLGNHESTTYSLLTDPNKIMDYDSKMINTFFNTYLDIKNEPEIIKKFIEIYEIMKPFYIFYGDKSSHAFYVNHSPCSSSQLYKIDSKSIKKQVYQYFTNATENSLHFFIAYKNNFDVPYQVVGHVQMNESYFTNNNKIFIDTGCVSGNKLTGVVLGNGVIYPKFRYVDFMKLQPALPHTRLSITNVSLLTKPNNINKSDTDVRKTVKFLMNNKINFISGTISPANKKISTPENQLSESSELESLEKALEYYYDKYKNNPLCSECSELIAMPKYMGSRINVYLFNDFEKTYGITRNGYLAKVDQQVFKELHTRLEHYMNTHNIKLIIVDGELMPWALLGQGLIDTTFKPISIGIQHTALMLQRTGFDLVQKKLLDNIDTLDNSSKKVLNEQKRSHISVDKLKSLGEEYQRQLEIYGQTTTPHIKAFSILKIVFKDDSEYLPGIINQNNQNAANGLSNSFSFQLVNNDALLVINLDMPYSDNLNILKTYFNELMSENHEGIVIRPNIIDPKRMCPYLKVRNENYLRLTYGYDYQEPYKYKQLLKRKNIKKKIELSKEQYQLGIKMLSIPYAELETNKQQIKKYIEKFLISNGVQVDPRL